MNNIVDIKFEAQKEKKKRIYVVQQNEKSITGVHT